MLRKYRRVSLVLADVVVIIAAALLANLLRFDEAFPTRRFPFFHRWIQLDLLVTPLSLYFFGLYRSAWRYTSIRDLLRIVQALALRTAVLVILYVALLDR